MSWTCTQHLSSFYSKMRLEKHLWWSLGCYSSLSEVATSCLTTLISFKQCWLSWLDLHWLQWYFNPLYVYVLTLKKILLSIAALTNNSLAFSCSIHSSATFLLWCLFYRIIECFVLESTFRAHLVQPPCSEQGPLQPDLFAQSLVQPDLEHFQGWGLHYLSGQPVPVFHYPYSKKHASVSPPCSSLLFLS